MGSDTIGVNGTVNFPLSVPSRNTWKHNLTAFKSILAGCLLCSKPAGIISNNLLVIFINKYIDQSSNYVILRKGSTRISSLTLNASSISFFLTHWIPKLAKVTVIFSDDISKVQTPRLHASFPTKLCG